MAIQESGRWITKNGRKIFISDDPTEKQEREIQAQREQTEKMTAEKQPSDAQLMSDSKKIYNTLRDLADKRKDTGYPETIKAMFNAVNGKVRFTQITPRYIAYDGAVKGADKPYTIGGSISMDYEQGDFGRLMEDLAMAYYRTHGGVKAVNTRGFLDALNKL